MIDKNTLKTQLQEISEVLKYKYQDEEHIGVLSGTSGIALFFFYYAKYLDDDVMSDIGVEIISHGIEKINEGYAYPTYCTGIAGFGWTVQHLNDEGFIELDCDDLLGPFDEYLYNQMQLDLSNKNFDFLHGAIGYGFYFLKRYKGTKTVEQKEYYLNCLKELVIGLEELAIKDGFFYKWECVLDIRKGNKGHNLSLSHGMASILFFLAKVSEISDVGTTAKTLLKGGMKYIMNFEDKQRTNRSIFPSWIEPGLTIEHDSRLAWCYGDLGIGLALSETGKVLNDPAMQKYALGILEHTTTKRQPKDTGVTDAGICHGSYGNALIYQTLFQKSNTAAFQQTMDFWIADGIEKAIHADGFAGYKQWDGLKNEWGTELSLLEGVAGIGLVIIDYLSKEPNTWNECLMIQ